MTKNRWTPISSTRLESHRSSFSLLDRRWRRFAVARNNNNSYTLGVIGKHNVIITILPKREYGISAAATVARDLVHSFPNIHIRLIVSVRGGAPTKQHNIRLSNIVIRSSLLNAVAGLKTNYMMWGPKLNSKGEHEDNPTIHYGLITSANQVMKNTRIQDKLSAERGVLCFKIEAASLINHFPCLVIRSIYNYSNSHKSKEWQGFAAIVAAAYAKDLLLQITPSSVEAEKPIGEVLSSS
ncbi:hypothetical protein K456DRAFT_1749730 [Colletotrichum gloeosporioides 23]|nr:hypothetical protein K456DRAFT_1749730 [Colletotrichum gloeosporioides 23]